MQLNNVRLKAYTEQFVTMVGSGEGKRSQACSQLHFCNYSGTVTLLVVCRAAAPALECSAPLIQQPSQFYPPPILTTYFPKIHLTN